MQNQAIRVEAMYDKYGNAVQEALGGGYEVRIPMEEPLTQYGLLARYFE
jgi:U32 family peptidase